MRKARRTPPRPSRSTPLPHEHSTSAPHCQIGSSGFVLAGRNAEDYKLTSTSIAKDHGLTQTYVTTD
jgi:hypothetical protein